MNIFSCCAFWEMGISRFKAASRMNCWQIVKKHLKNFYIFDNILPYLVFLGYSKFGLWPMPSFQDQSLHWNFGSEIKLKNRRCQGWVGGKRTFWIFICLRICSFWLCCGKLWLKWKRSLSWKKKFSAFLQSRGLPCGVKFCSSSMVYNQKKSNRRRFFEAAVFVFVFVFIIIFVSE